MSTRLERDDVHWVHSPQNQSESANGSEEGSGLGVLRLNNVTTVDGELVDDSQIGNASDGIISPLCAWFARQGSKETSQNHDDVSDNGYKNVGTAQAGEKSKIQEQEWGGNTPINVAGPVDLAEDDVFRVRHVFLRFLDGNLIQGNAIVDSHGEISNGRKGRDEGSQDMEQSFLLEHR